MSKHPKFNGNYEQEVIKKAGSDVLFEKQLTQSLGWNKTQFKKYIIEPIVLATQMSEYISTHDTSQTFEEIVKEYLEKARVHYFVK